ncbi:hypothetical protein PJI17_32200, partial [Mycobacterium kansasii]
MTLEEFTEAMLMELKELDNIRLQALDILKVHKLKVVKAYNKKVNGKSFGEGEMVWKKLQQTVRRITSMVSGRQ